MIMAVMAWGFLGAINILGLNVFNVKYNYYIIDDWYWILILNLKY